MSPGERSRALAGRAAAVMPGGVSSPVRAFTAVGGEAPVFARARGCRLWDEDGREYLDFVMAFGPHILGHGHPAVRAALARQAERGLALGGTTAVEVELAERIVAAVPSVQMVRFVSSGTEATMSALRLARAVTARDRIVKCAGGYHGHGDALLVDAGSGAEALGVPSSPGVPAAVARDTVAVPYNDAAAVAAALERDGGDRVAAVIVEPVAGNMGCVPPAPGYLAALREVTRRHGTLLVFDEVITGFRLARGGAQALFGVTPDLTCLGKVIGGGLPAAAYGGPRELMERMAPSGPVYQAGTLSGSPMAMAAGCAVLDMLADPALHRRIDALGLRLADGLGAAARDAGVPCAVNRAGSMVTAFCGVDAVTDLASARRADAGLFARVHRAWLDAGVLWPPSQMETAFLSTAHAEPDVDRAAEVFAAALRTASEPPQHGLRRPGDAVLD